MQRKIGLLAKSDRSTRVIKWARILLRTSSLISEVSGTLTRASRNMAFPKRFISGRRHAIAFEVGTRYFAFIRQSREGGEETFVGKNTARGGILCFVPL